MDIDQDLISYITPYAFALTLHNLKMNYNSLPISMSLSTHIGCHKDLIPKLQNISNENNIYSLLSKLKLIQINNNNKKFDLERGSLIN